MSASRSGFYRRRDGAERLWVSQADIEAVVEEALRKSDLFPTDERPAVDIELFIQRLGVRMDQYAELPAEVLGQTEFYPDSPPKIFINRDLTGAVDSDTTLAGTRGRWRATLSHEASHVLLHRILFEINRDQQGLFRLEEPQTAQRLMRCLKKNVLFRANGINDWREVQANMAMAALLMPRGHFLRIATKVVEERGLNPEALVSGSPTSTKLAAEISALLDVSKQAAGIRLETLGIVSRAGQAWLADSVT